jgi:pimeloyl-ACP methyl ester carboxylesterase
MASVTARGVRFNVQLLGDGPRLLVGVHALVVDNLSSWYFTIAGDLARRHSLLLYDLRGHGRSEQPPAGYTLAEMVADLAALLEVVGNGRSAVILGNSYGGLIALEFGRRHPERTAGIALVEGQVADDRYAGSLSELAGVPAEAREERAREVYANWIERRRESGDLSPDSAEFDDRLRAKQGRRRKPMSSVAERLVHETSLVADMGRRAHVADEQLRAVRCPVLALYGERSDILDQGRRIAAAAPDSRLVIVPGATHFLLFEQPARVTAEIESWLDGLPPPQA